MNKQRRKEIAQIVKDINELRDRVEAVKDEEQEYYDSMPQSMVENEKGERAQEVIFELEQCDSVLSDAIDHLETAGE